MPRWPAGLHLASGAVPAVGQRPLRTAATPQHHYWRRTSTELHASATATIPPGQGFLASGAPIFEQAQVGPSATGELWRVTLVEVQLPGLYDSPPLVTQQISAQVQGAVTQPPPPFVAQVFLAAGGTNLHLLAQTTQGGYDTLELGGQEVSPGEAIVVRWWTTTDKFFPGFGWFVLRGTRLTLSAT